MSDTDTVDWVAKAKGSDKLWPAPDEQTILGHLDVTHGLAEARGNLSLAECVDWHKSVHHGAEMNHRHHGQLDTQAIFDAAVARLPEKTQWFYAAQGDQLRPEQVHRIFQDPNGENEVYDEILSYNDDYRYGVVTEYLQDAIPDEEEREALRDDAEDLYDELRDIIAERDESDPIGDLANGWRMLVRYRLGDTPGDYTDLAGNSWNWSQSEVYRAARHLAKVAGLPWEDPYKQKMRELVVNSTYGGELFIFWYASVKQVVQAAAEVHGGLNPKRTITWTDPTLLCLDYYNGSGHEVRLEGEFSRPFEPERLQVDSEGYGYGWDKIAGVVHSAYDTRCTITVDEGGK